MGIDLEATGQAVGATLLAVGAVASGVWNFVLKNKVAIAKTKVELAKAEVEVSKSDSARTVEDAGHKIVTMLMSRLAAVEQDVKELRAELAREREDVRARDSYIWVLVKILRDKSIEFPTFEASSYRLHS